MAMSMQKSWSARAVIIAAMLMGSISSAAWSPQEPGRSPALEEQRRRLQEQLNRQVQDAMQGAKQPPGPVVQQPQPVPSSGPTVNPTPPAGITQSLGQKIQVNYENVELYSFITELSSMLGITPILIDPDVKGSVTIHSSTPLGRDEILPIYSQVLKNNNAALVKQGDIYQIVPISSALKKGIEIIDYTAGSDNKSVPDETSKSKTDAIPSKTGKEVSSSPEKTISSTAPQAGAKTALAPVKGQIPAGKEDKNARLATHIIRADFVPIKDLLDPISKFMTDGGIIFPYEKLNMMIITDYSDNVDRLVKLIRMLDDAYLDPDLIEPVEIKNNTAGDVTEDLVKFFGAGTKDSATGVQFIPLDRRNLIFVKASSKRALAKAKEYIALLDSTSGKNIQTFTYAVQNSTASQIAMMLSALYGGEGSSTGTSGGTGGQTGGTATGQSPGYSRNQGGAFGNSTFGNQSGQYNAAYQGE
jgi:type II secretory pathway component GspD/PulD (secretin)